MKKKLLVILMATTMVISTLTGCGSSNSASKSGEITVSEMINSLLEENGGTVYLYDQWYNGKMELGKDEGVQVYKYDGSSLSKCDSTIDIGEFALGNQSAESLQYNMEISEASLALLTDSTGNSVRQEIFYCKTNDREYQEFGFTNFRHMTIYDKSYMVFSVSNPEKVWYSCMAIEDTDYTKDKEIVFDSIGTDGIAVDPPVSDSSFWDMITQ